MRVSVDKEKLMAIIKEKSECDCTGNECPAANDCGLHGSDDCCDDELRNWLDVKDLPDDSHDAYLLPADERAILRNVLPKYKYIARDSDCRLYLYAGLPVKATTSWAPPFDSVFWCAKVFENLFQCVQWSDEKPWLITDLLKAKKPTVDWSKVAVDTKVLVHWSDGSWGNRHFAEYKNGVVYCFDGGKTSFTAHSSLDKKGTMARWEDVKLYEEDNHEE